LVYFVDAAHFVHAPFLGFLWCFCRVFIKAPSGRQRFNVLGAVNAVSQQVLTVCNDSYINATTVCELLKKMAERHAGAAVTVVMDNARYQRCKLVQTCAQQLGIEIIYLPTYSPNLNLIERLWKFVKKQVLYGRYYSTFSQFTQAISDCLGDTSPEHQAALRTLLSLKFQTFPEDQLKAA
jgi:transposase